MSVTAFVVTTADPANAVTLQAISAVPDAASVAARVISAVVAVCSSTADAIGELVVVDARHDAGDFGDGGDGVGGVVLDRVDPARDVFSRSRGLLGELVDLAGHDRDSLACFAGPGRLDGGVQGQQVVCSAIAVMTRTTLPISCDETSSRST